MDQMTENLLLFLNESRLKIDEIKKADGQKSTYVIVFKTAHAQHHSIASFTLNFKFDMDSFLIRFSELYPDHNANESFVLEGISLFFHEVADHVLIMGGQGYDDFAQKLQKKKLDIIGGRFGIS